MKNLFLLVMFLFVASKTIAQSDSLTWKEKRQEKKAIYAANNEVFRSSTLVLSQTKIQDTRMSPLIFAGLGLTLNLSKLRYGTKSLGKWDLNLGYHGARNTPGSWNLMHIPRLELNYFYERKVNNKWGLLYVGAGIQNLLNSRIYLSLGNNALGLDYSSSLSPGLTFIKEKLGKSSQWDLLANLNFSLVAFTLRFPQFAYEGIETRILPIGLFSRGQFEVGAIKKLKYSEENKFYVAYAFDFYSFGSSIDDKRIAQYMNSIKLAFWLKTK